MGIMDYYPHFTVEKKDVFTGISGDSRPRRSTGPSAGTDPVKRKAGAGEVKRERPAGRAAGNPLPL
jgi:hypothetical protein